MYNCDGMPEAYDHDLRTMKYWDEKAKKATEAAIKAAQERRNKNGYLFL